MAYTIETDVIIAGMGPTGLVIANLLGKAGVRVEIFDKRDRLIDYPRGVGMDDESYRTVQSMNLLEEFAPYTIPHHVMRIVNGKGEVIMTNDPAGEPFGHPRKFGYIQPLVDKAMFEALERYNTVSANFGWELTKIVDHGGDAGVTAEVTHVTGVEGEEKTGDTTTIKARYLVGCEGGRSFTRKFMGVDFEGVSPSTRWVVVDCNNDPLGMPNVYLGADPNRPYVSISLPHGIRRFEFMLFDDEPNERVEDDDFVAELLHEHLPEGTKLDIIRRRVFTHHGRVASEFRKGNVMVAGDAAHLMPVWMGQGFNSGFRDATNIAWKLAGCVQGKYGDGILDTYSKERHDHAKAMVDLSLTLGNVIKPTDKRIAFGRDAIARAMNLSPSVKSYFTDMRFKPMPRYAEGVVVDQTTLDSGKAAAKVKEPKGTRKGIIPFRNVVNKQSVVGVQFIQPKVGVENEVKLMDYALGDDFAIITWGLDPAKLLPAEDVQDLRARGVHFVCAVSPTQKDWADANTEIETTVVTDVTGQLKIWFDQHSVGTAIVRPDRFIAAGVLNASLPKAIESLRKAAHMK